MVVLGAAWAASIGLGLIFVFVKAPHPWGWEGFDSYRNLALTLARDGSYGTMEVPWGYPAFLAVFYAIFGDRQWIPLLVQVCLNSLIPLMVYAAMHRRVGEREARIGALLVGVGSFTTVYASTQTSDALAAFLFVTATVLMLRARERRAWWAFAASGLAVGAASQLRPNLLLLPLWFAAVSWWLDRRARGGPAHSSRPAFSTATQLSVFLLAAYAVTVPWTIRNARLAGRLIPASTHGGIQLWYGTLQVAPFFPNWFDNPRAVYSDRTFDFTRPDGRNLIISVGEWPGGNCFGIFPQTVAPTYWTDRDPTPTKLPPQTWRPGGVHFPIPPQPADTAVYYYFDATWASSEGIVAEQTPPPGALDPMVHFVTTNDFGDQDRHDDFVDVFDVVRLVRHQAWREPLADGPAHDFDRDGTIANRDLERAVGLMMSDKTKPIAVEVRGLVRTVTSDESAATLVFSDNSTLKVPRNFSGSVLDLDVEGLTARAAVYNRRTIRSAHLSAETVPALRTFHECFKVAGSIDSVFYRAQPSAQDRFTRLALDNVSRDSAAYAVASLRRMIGIFVTTGSSDRSAAHQFSASNLLYSAGRVLSLTLFGLFLAGVAVAVTRGADVALLVAAVFYVPVTLSPFLGNARYMLSAQPFVLGFVAVALVAAYDTITARRRRRTAESLSRSTT